MGSNTDGRSDGTGGQGVPGRLDREAEGVTQDPKPDITERLRSTADALRSMDATVIDAPDGKSLYREAADTIDALRAEVERLGNKAGAQAVELSILGAEVERLRERPGERIGGKVLGDLARENERLEAEVERLRAAVWHE